MAGERRSCFCMTFYPEGILLINADNQTVDAVRAVTEECFPLGVKETARNDADGSVMIRVNQNESNAAEAGNMIYSNNGKLLSCNILSRLSDEGWSVLTSGNLDSICVYNLPEEVYPSTTLFFQRSWEVESGGVDEEEEVEEEYESEDALDQSRAY